MRPWCSRWIRRWPRAASTYLRNGFTIPFKFTRRNVVDVLMHPRWLLGVLGRYMLASGMPRYMNFPAHMQTRLTALPMGRSTALNDTISWNDVRELRKLWPRTLIVKGMQHPRDAVLAADCGADAVVLSNHGGRVLDSSPPPILTLPQVVAAVKKRITVIVDSGFRRGSDVVKGLALGADAVMVGRAPLHGTASAGEPGALRALQIYRDEIDRVMALIGASIADLNPEYVAMPDCEVTE